jgi:uncharacterized membrane protein
VAASSRGVNVFVFVLRLIFGLTFLLVLPGLALVSALFPRQADLKGIERLALAVGISISITAGVSALLNFTPWGIELSSMVMSIGFITIVFAVVGYYRFRNTAVGKVAVQSARKNNAVRIGGLLFGIAVAILMIAFGVNTYHAVIGESEENITQLFLQSADGSRLEGPIEVGVGEPVSFVIGVVNHEHAAMPFTVEILNNDSDEQIDDFYLENSESWTSTYTLHMDTPGENQEVSIFLYKGIDKTPYRTLHMWVTVRDEGDL